jgi:hypothetical protein
MEAKKNQTASPLEKRMRRPALYVMAIEAHETREIRLCDGIWLKKRNKKIVVRERTIDVFPELPGKMTQLPVGTVTDGLPLGPKYTGPIDDEMMANIMMFG